MIEVFGTVGTSIFDVTFTTEAGKKAGWFPGRTAESVLKSLPSLLERSQSSRFNVIIRPHGKEGLQLVQLDDLSIDMAARVIPVSFLILETSGSNFQAWVAVSGPDDLSSRLRQGTGADATASGATRLCRLSEFQTETRPGLSDNSYRL